MAFGGDSLDDVEEAIDFGARGVDGEEDGVQAGFLGGAGGVDGGLHGAIEGPAVGVLDHVVAGGNFDHHAGTAASLDDLDLFGDTAGEGEDFGLQAQRGDILNGRFVLLGDGGHAGFDAVHAEGIELLGDGHFFLAAEDDGGLLLAIAQGDIVDFDLGGEVIFLGDFGKIRPGADKPFIRFPRASAFSLRRLFAPDSIAPAAATTERANFVIPRCCVAPLGLRSPGTRASGACTLVSVGCRHHTRATFGVQGTRRAQRAVIHYRRYPLPSLSIIAVTCYRGAHQESNAIRVQQAFKPHTPELLRAGPENDILAIPLFDL